MKRHFFKRYQGRGSYDLFSSYSHYLPGIKGMMALLLFFLIGAILGNLVIAGLSAVFGGGFASEYGTLISYPVMFIPPLLYASVKSRIDEYAVEAVPLDRGGFAARTWAQLVAAGTFSTIACAYIVEPISLILPQMPESIERSMKLLLEGMPLWATLLSVSVFAPLFEELLCRGIVLRGLLQKMHPASAIAISAAFFAILHMNPWQALPAFCLGLLFGYVYYRTGSLKTTMLMHCANNTMAVIFSKIPQFKEAETFMDILSPWAYWGVYAACILILCSTLVIFRNSAVRE